MLTKEQLIKYGIPEEDYQREYEKTIQYQLDKLEKALKPIFDWLERQLSGCGK